MFIMGISEIENSGVDKEPASETAVGTGEELLSVLNRRPLILSELLYIIESTMGGLLIFGTEEKSIEINDFPKTYLSFPNLEGLADIRSLFLELIVKIRTYFEERGIEKVMQDLEPFQEFWNNCKSENDAIKNCLDLFFSEYLGVDLGGIVNRYKSVKVEQYGVGKVEVYYFIGLLLISHIFIKYLLSLVTKERVYEQLREYFDQDIEGLKEDPLKVLDILLNWYRKDPLFLIGSDYVDDSGAALFKPISLPHYAEAFNGGHCGYGAFISRIVLKDCGINEMSFVVTKGHIFVIAKIGEVLYRVDLAQNIIRPLKEDDLSKVEFLIKSEWGYLWALFVNEYSYELHGSNEHTVLNSSYFREFDFRNNAEAREFYKYLLEVFRSLIIGMMSPS